MNTISTITSTNLIYLCVYILILIGYVIFCCGWAIAYCFTTLRGYSTVMGPILSKTKPNACFIMTSWHGNAFRITGPLWGESIGKRSHVVFDISLYKLLNKHLTFGRFNKPLWRHYNIMGYTMHCGNMLLRAVYIGLWRVINIVCYFTSRSK